eukprot:TRINITY_DN10420_c0_g3_i4.p1 TRINITY_DN10420_c0_g3~~TRINITY_DN10420_c0_g3_i4.p1  ORF type:complete len:491 (+),score=83.18 TRINITY_DN10420_c0_g3_i4:95-1567(+)
MIATTYFVCFILSSLSFFFFLIFTSPGVSYQVSGRSAPKPVEFKLSQQFASQEDRDRPTVFSSLYYLLDHSLKHNVLLSCSSHPPEATSFEEKTPDGLLLKHEYSVVSVATLPGNEHIIRLKNPHGQGSVEWNGAWGDDDPNWTKYPTEQAKYVGGADGSFCMPLDVWRARFTHCSMVKLYEAGWRTYTFKGMVMPNNCGPTGNVHKPKYHFKTKGPATRIHITLSQPDNKRFENSDEYNIAIGLRVVMELKTLSGTIPGTSTEYDREDTICIAEVTPQYSRQVSVELVLDEINTGMGQYFRGEGSYYVIPYTQEANVVLPYVLNISSFNVDLPIGTMKHINHAPRDTTRDHPDLYTKRYYDTYVPEYQPYLDHDFGGGSSSKGRAELVRAKGRSEMARSKGRSEMARAKGRTELARAKGRVELARAKGRTEIGRAKGRAEVARSKGANPASSQSSKRDVPQASASSSSGIPDADQDALEAAFRREYEIA